MTLSNRQALRRAARAGLFLFIFHIGLAFGQVRILQTNSGGDNISLIDPATNKVVAEIRGVPVNHGAAAATNASSGSASSDATSTQLPRYVVSE